jgi:hypothetical protein
MNVDPLTTLHRCATSLRGLVRPFQSFFLAALVAAAIPAVRAVELRLGNTYPLTFTDVDQHQLSTSDGHVTIITVVTRKDEQKAQIVGDRFPRGHLGDPKYRLIMVVNFQQKIFPPFRGIVAAIIRHRLDVEAKELQKIYSAKHLNRDPRYDIFVVADFDGKIVSQLGVAPASTEFAVFMFDGSGRLIRRWNDAPSADALTAAIDEAH